MLGYLPINIFYQVLNLMKVKLFCIPYAGGTSSIYKKWEPHLAPNVHLRPIELAGKGRRLKDPFYQNITEAVDDVFELIKNEIDNSPYMIFGHSMGAKIAYKLAQKIESHQLNTPLHLFISGSSAPHFKREDEEIFHLMENDVFKQKLIDLGGTPPDFFDHPELVELFLPALKNDFQIVETAQYEDSIMPLSSDISVLIGKEDILTLEQQEAWSNYTQQNCKIYYFEGGHFFFVDETHRVTGIINQVLSSHSILL